jgi:hypothetical protein
MPVPANAHLEGFPNPGDQHVLVLDRNNCWLYELYASEHEWKLERGVGGGLGPGELQRVAPNMDFRRRCGLTCVAGVGTL